MTEQNNNLEGFDAAKRQTLKRLVATAAFAVPVVASFSIDAMTVSSALAQCANAPNATCS
jgi:hypothetical protein